MADLRKASAVAVDSSRGYFFVVEQVQSLQEGELKPLESSVVNRYGFVLEVPLKNEDGGVIEPQLHVDIRTKTQVY